MDPVDTSANGFQSQVFWKLFSQVGVLNIGVSDVGFKTLTPQKEAPSCELAANCGLMLKGGTYSKIVS